MKNSVKIVMISTLSLIIVCVIVCVWIYIWQSSAQTGTGIVEPPSRWMMATELIGKYEGKLKAQELKKLIKEVNKINKENLFPEGISIENESNLLLEKKDGQYKIVNKIELNKIYKVEMIQYDDTYGCVKTITISEAE